MALSSGMRLGPYEILAPLGAGGMGEVYRARDTRLDRAVAIKILPQHLSDDPLRKQRFEREAKTISSLNHPHICVLHDVGHQDGIDYLVMECLEGETLAKRLEKGALPLEQVLKYGGQIADALDKAHRSGVVHRDLKPGNIVLGPEGAKLLDFGLAKPMPALPNGVTLTAATPQGPATEDGTILGTFQYMSPEQVEGKEVDARSDLFSLGAVLYEMVTGKKAFEGKSQLSVASAILEKEPQPMAALKPMTPTPLEHLVRRCLAKDREGRWQTARDLALELKWLAESGSPASFPARILIRKPRLLMLAVGAMLLGLLVLGVLWRGLGGAEQTAYYFAPLAMSARDLALGPDGRTAAMIGYSEPARKNVIWIYEVGSQTARTLANTEGAEYPFWSPDGKWVGFFGDGRLKKIEVATGQVRTICDAPSGRGGTWNRSDVIVFSPSSRQQGLYQVTASGGTPRQVTQVDISRKETSHRWPMFLPDGKHFLFMAATFSGFKDVDAIFVGALDSKQTKFITAADANAAYAEPGYLLYCRGRALLAQAFDLKKLEVNGEATDLLASIQYVPQVKRATFSVSNGGVLLVQSGGPVAIGYSQPKWFDRSGKELGDLDKPGVYGNVSIAPNARSMAADQYELTSLNLDIWLYDSSKSAAPKRLTFDPGYDGGAVWNPDGTQIVFSSNRHMNLDLYVKNADGGQQETDIFHDNFDKLANDWSRDGKYILFRHADELWYLNVAGFTPKPYLKTSGILRNGQFSPDGKWVAYNSNETGKWEIYVSSFPEPQGKWQVSTGGGEQPRWRSDAKELFYLSADAHIMAVPVSTGAVFTSGTPVSLFAANPSPPVSYLDIFWYDVSRDGQKFLINTEVKPADALPVSVLLNWPAKLQK